MLPPIVAVLMGMVTAVFGGVLRDVVCNEIPSAFRDRRPYAVCSFIGGWVLVLVNELGASDWTCTTADALAHTSAPAKEPPISLLMITAVCPRESDNA